VEIQAFNKDFEIVGILKPFNFQWRRRYYACGDYELLINANEYDSTMRYIYFRDRNEVAFINKVEYKESSQGKFIYLTGYFIEYILYDFLDNLQDRTWATGKLGYYLNTLVASIPSKDVPITIAYNPNVNDIGSKVTVNADAYKEIGEVCYKLVETQECSQKLKYDINTNYFIYDVWQGLDRTQSQSINPFLTFSDTIGNLKNIDVSVDDSDYKNYCVVVGKTATVIVDWSNGGYKKSIKIDKTSVAKQDDQTDAEYIEALKTEGTLALLNHKKRTNIKFDVDKNYYEYLKDYNLGDKADVIINKLGTHETHRIIEVHEIYKDNKQEIKIVLGDKKKKIYEKSEVLQ